MRYTVRKFGPRKTENDWIQPIERRRIINYPLREEYNLTGLLYKFNLFHEFKALIFRLDPYICQIVNHEFMDTQTVKTVTFVQVGNKVYVQLWIKDVLLSISSTSITFSYTIKRNLLPEIVAENPPYTFTDTIKLYWDLLRVILYEDCEWAVLLH